MFTFHFPHTLFWCLHAVLEKIFIDLAAELYDRADCSTQLLPPGSSTFLVICNRTNMQNDTCKRVLLTTGDSSEKHHFVEMGDSFQINKISWHQSSAICKCPVHVAPICTSAIPTPPTCVNKTPQTFSQMNVEGNDSGDTRMSHSLVRRQRKSFRDETSQEQINGGEMEREREGLMES